MSQSITVATNGRVLLNDPTCRRPKHIATLVGDVLTIKKREEQIHRVSNSIGVNEEMVKSVSFKILRIVFTSGPLLETTREFLLAKGRLAQYAPFESQIFLPIKDFGLDKALEFEKGLKRKKKVVSIKLSEALEMMRRKP